MTSYHGSNNDVFHIIITSILFALQSYLYSKTQVFHKQIFRLA